MTTLIMTLEIFSISSSSLGPCDTGPPAQTRFQVLSGRRLGANAAKSEPQQWSHLIVWDQGTWRQKRIRQHGIGTKPCHFHREDKLHCSTHLSGCEGLDMPAQAFLKGLLAATVG